jgi:plastocyanin
MNLRSTTLLLAALALTGCKHAAVPASDATPTPAVAVASVAAPVDPATAGSIAGTVNFSGKAPARIAIDMSMDPACAMAAEPNLTEQYMVDHGHLANVYVYVKAGVAPSSAPASTPPVVLDQKGCRYTPHVIALQQGGQVEFRNADPTMHNIHTTPDNGTQPIDISQTPMGAPVNHRFMAAETMLPVRCNNHPWMEAFVNVSPNAYFAVTKADGSFTIANLPPGTYTLAAIHEKLGEQDMQVTVGPKATGQATFSFSAR